MNDNGWWLTLPEPPEQPGGAQAVGEVEQLLGQLAACRAATASAELRAVEQLQQLRAELARTDESVHRLTVRLAEKQNLISRMSAEQTVIVGALRGLVDAVSALDVTTNTDDERGAFAAALIQAMELLSLVEVPFG